MKTLLRIVGIILVNIMIIALFLEGLLRVAAPSLPPSLQISANWVMTGQPYAEDWTPAWQQNRDHFYALRPNIENQIQYGSPRVRFSLTTIEPWEGAGIGFRTDPVDFRVDAVVVGDSFGFCFTERDDCWVDQLAAQSGLGIVNLSQPVTGTTSHTRMLEDFAVHWSPPLVIWQFFGNDFNEDYGLAVLRDEVDEIDDSAADHAETASDTSLHGWMRRNSVAYAVAETAITGRFQGFAETEEIFAKPHTVTYGENDEHTLIYGSQYEQIALDMSREDNQIGYALSQESFREAQALVESWGGEMVVVFIPVREEVYAHLTEAALGAETLAAMESSRAAMRDICDANAIPCYDPIDDFTARAQAGEALYHVDDMHLNPHGNAVLADVLQAWLQSIDIATLNN